ncbi:hypothetical protein [Cetobacterium sp.]|uniref:hypothetical protein n=1 Tax=Cetobacterium sp. TaxID=2071632 RepID=UPI002FC68638
MKNNSFFKHKRKRTLFFANIVMILFIAFQLLQMGLNDEESMTFLLFLLGDILLLGFQIVEILKGNTDKK